MNISELAADRPAIRELIESWAVWRDSGDWIRLRSVWPDDGPMIATWFPVRCAARGLARAQKSVDPGLRRSAITGRVARHQGDQCRRGRRNRGHPRAAVPGTG